MSGIWGPVIRKMAVDDFGVNPSSADMVAFMVLKRCNENTTMIALRGIMREIINSKGVINANT